MVAAVERRPNRFLDRPSTLQPIDFAACYRVDPGGGVPARGRSGPAVSCHPPPRVDSHGGKRRTVCSRSTPPLEPLAEGALALMASRLNGATRLGRS